MSLKKCRKVSDLDWMDLNDWILFNDRPLYEATKYLHLSVQMACWVKAHGNDDVLPEFEDVR